MTTIPPSQISQLVEVRQGDTQRIIYDQLLLGGTPINLSGSTVTLVFYDPVAKTVVRRAGDITVAASGSVQYQLESDDLANTGSRLLEWECVDQLGRELTIPTTTYIKMNILPDLR